MTSAGHAIALCVRAAVLGGALCLPAAVRAQEPPPPPPCRIAGIVLKWVRGDKQANLDRLAPLVQQAAAEGAHIICTTECFLDGYAIADKALPLADYLALGEEIPQGDSCRQLADLAQECQVYLLAGMLEAAGERRYNAAVLFDHTGRFVGKYRKQELGHELDRNTPGDASGVFETPWGNMGVVICADRTQPDLVRACCEAGADFIVCPSGGMFGPERNHPILQARSRETSRTIVFVHPAEFLATGPAGDVLDAQLLGDRLLVTADQIDGPHDLRRVFYVDLPAAHR